MMLSKWVYQLLIFSAVIVHFFIGYAVERTEVGTVQLCFGVLWLVFLIQWADQKISAKQIVAVGMLLRLVYLIAVPQLSDDVYRYLWDGSLTVHGISPYAALPNQFVEQTSIEGLNALFPLLNSPAYYSIYPPVSQAIFAASWWLGGGDILHSITALRVVVLLAEFASMCLILLLLKKWGLPARNAMLYALNPLVIVEFAGNLHTEVFMVFFLLLSIWFLTSRKLVLSGFVFGLAVGAKLLPLMFLPFYIKRLGWGKTLLYGLVVGVTVLVLFAPFATPNLPENIQTSIRLYFANFEFNASIYYIIRAIGFELKGYNIIAQTAIWLPRIVLVSILGIALLNKQKSAATLPKLMLFAWLVYYAFSTTVNPWYIAVFAAFLPFVTYRFGLIWMMLVGLSYHAFSISGFHENLYVVALEYIPVYTWLAFELNLLKPLERKWALSRAAVKRKRLTPYLKTGESVLEVGAGNGALTKLLGNEGMQVSAIDIKDQSLFKDVEVQVYNGTQFPFAEKYFNTCQLITMLHHTTNAEQLLVEAKRVANRVVVMEDVYANTAQKYLTWFTDSVVNWEFYGHPHTNLTDQEWQQLFTKHNLQLEAIEHHRFLLFFKQVTYVLVPND